MAQRDSSRGFWRSQPFYVRLTAGGLLAFVLVRLVTGVTSEFGGQPGSMVFIAVPAVPTAVIALLALRIGGWALKLASIWALLFLLLSTFMLASSLAHINSFWDFAPALAALVTLLAAAVGGGMSFVQRRRGAIRQTATTGARRSLVGATAVVGALVVLSGLLNVTSIESVSADARAGAVAVGMEETQFDPTQLMLRAGQPATLVVKNNDLRIHTFTIPELGISEVVLGGSEKLIAIAASNPGNFEFVCEIQWHDAMKGTLVVEAAVQ